MWTYSLLHRLSKDIICLYLIKTDDYRVVHRAGFVTTNTNI